MQILPGFFEVLHHRVQPLLRCIFAETVGTGFFMRNHKAQFETGLRGHALQDSRPTPEVQILGGFQEVTDGLSDDRKLPDAAVQLS